MMCFQLSCEHFYSITPYHGRQRKNKRSFYLITTSNESHPIPSLKRLKQQSNQSNKNNNNKTTLRLRINHILVQKISPLIISPLFVTLIRLEESINRVGTNRNEINKEKTTLLRNDFQEIQNKKPYCIIISRRSLIKYRLNT